MQSAVPQKTTEEIREELCTSLRAQLPREMRGPFDTLIDSPMDGRDEAKEQLRSLENEREEEVEQLARALEHVRDWLHDVLVLNRPMRDPRKVMRVVDDALWER